MIPEGAPSFEEIFGSDDPNIDAIRSVDRLFRIADDEEDEQEP